MELGAGWGGVDVVVNSGRGDHMGYADSRKYDFFSFLEETFKKKNNNINVNNRLTTASPVRRKSLLQMWHLLTPHNHGICRAL